MGGGVKASPMAQNTSHWHLWLVGRHTVRVDSAAAANGGSTPPHLLEYVGHLLKCQCLSFNHFNQFFLNFFLHFHSSLFKRSASISCILARRQSSLQKLRPSVSKGNNLLWHAMQRFILHHPLRGPNHPHIQDDVRVPASDPESLFSSGGFPF